MTSQSNTLSTRRIKRVASSLIFSFLLLTACNGGPKVPAQPLTPPPTFDVTPEPTNVVGTLDVCSYLTKADVQTVLDEPVTQVTANNRAYDMPVTPSGNCTYLAGAEAIVIAIARPNAAKGSSDWTVAQTTWFSNASYNANVTTVTDLGEAALWSEATNGKGGGGYAVAKYPYLVDVLIAGVLPNSPETYGVKLLKLTQKVLSELK